MIGFKQSSLGLISVVACVCMPLMVMAADSDGADSNGATSDLPTLSDTNAVNAESEGAYSDSATSDLPTLSDTDAVNTESEGIDLGLADRFKLNGFLSAGMLMTNASGNAAYDIPEHGEVTNDPSFGASTLIGLQLTAKLNDQFSAVGQLVASGDDTNGNTAYDVDSAWAFLQYQPASNVKVNFGRMRLPLFMYSDTIQVGYSYPYSFLPNEVYRIVPFYNMNGISTIYERSIGASDWTLQAQPFYGQNNSQYDVITKGGSEFLTDYDENNFVGASVTLSNSNMEFHASYSHLELTATPTGSSTASFNDADTSFYSFGAKFNVSNVLLSGEYAHRDVPDGVAELTGFYGTVGYQLEKFLPTLTYAHLKTDNQDDLNDNDEAPEAQESYTFSLAYYLTDRIDLKASIGDIHLLDGTKGMFDSDPGKSNVWLYGLGVDAIF